MYKRQYVHFPNKKPFDHSSAPCAAYVEGKTKWPPRHEKIHQIVSYRGRNSKMIFLFHCVTWKRTHSSDFQTRRSGVHVVCLPFFPLNNRHINNIKIPSAYRSTAYKRGILRSNMECTLLNPSL
jgi:hypothetical protein